MAPARITLTSSEYPLPPRIVTLPKPVPLCSVGGYRQAVLATGSVGLEQCWLDAKFDTGLGGRDCMVGE